MGGWVDCRVGTDAENRREMSSAGSRDGCPVLQAFSVSLCSTVVETLGSPI